MAIQDSTPPPMMFPDADSPNIRLAHPTAEECLKIWRLSSLEWRDALTLRQYLEESAFLATVPLAKNDGMTTWILVDGNLPPDERPILCACESFRKRSYISSMAGELTEGIVHGVASVFTDPSHRRHGYASRLMREMNKALQSWQVTEHKCFGSVLYSDIGKEFYTRFGWHPFPNNSHVEFPPSMTPPSIRAAPLFAEDLDQLCKEDELMIKRNMTKRSGEGKLQMVIVPNLNHMLWHHTKEEFACKKLFGKLPLYKGAIAGDVGNRIWAIWTHRYYGDPESAASGNTLYILRLVVDNEAAANNYDKERQKLQVAYLRAVLRTAQAEATEWNLTSVQMWDPSSLVLDMIEQTHIEYCKRDREDESIASLLWYGEGSGKEDMLEWVANEKYAWC